VCVEEKETGRKKFKKYKKMLEPIQQGEIVHPLLEKRALLKSSHQNDSDQTNEESKRAAPNKPRLSSNFSSEDEEEDDKEEDEDEDEDEDDDEEEDEEEESVTASEPAVTKTFHIAVHGVNDFLCECGFKSACKDEIICHAKKHELQGILRRPGEHEPPSKKPRRSVTFPTDVKDEPLAAAANTVAAAAAAVAEENPQGGEVNPQVQAESKTEQTTAQAKAISVRAENKTEQTTVQAKAISGDDYFSQLIVEREKASRKANEVIIRHLQKLLLKSDSAELSKVLVSDLNRLQHEFRQKGFVSAMAIFNEGMEIISAALKFVGCEANFDFDAEYPNCCKLCGVIFSTADGMGSQVSQSLTNFMQSEPEVCEANRLATEHVMATFNTACISRAFSKQKALNARLLWNEFRQKGLTAEAVHIEESFDITKKMMISLRVPVPRELENWTWPIVSSADCCSTP
jgi:hypothetical protein